MKVTFNIYYTGTDMNARKFAKEMIDEGIVDAIRAENGNIRYDYFLPIDDENTVLLIDCWENQRALDLHHSSEMMNKIIELRKKYNLSMKVERYTSSDISEGDKRYMCR